VANQKARYNVAINRLKHLCTYLSGAIDFTDDMGCKWRDDITPFLEDMNIRVFNPLKHAFYGAEKLDLEKRPYMDTLLEHGEFELLREEIKDISRMDLRAVDLSSFLIVNYDIDTFTCGTHDEIFLASRQRKPVLLMIGKGKMKKMPKWIYGRFPPEFFFETWGDLKEYLTRINSLQNLTLTEEEKKRWLWFEGEHNYNQKG